MDRRQFLHRGRLGLLLVEHLTRHDVVGPVDRQYVDMHMAIAHTGGVHHDLKRRKDGVNSERHPLHEEHHGRVERVLDGVEAGDVRLGNDQEVPRG